jgi:putative ABC transport system ATP-binding protein
VTPAPPRPPLAIAAGVRKVYGAGAAATAVLHGVSLTIAPGALTLLMGPSGSGKTTLLAILAGLARPTSGRVELCGHDITDGEERAIAAVRRAHVGFVFQTHALFPALSALDNIAEVLAMRGLALGAARERAREALARVGLAARAHHLPARLSAGERQRVAIARAMAGDPPLILGDEPTAALDGENAGNVLALLREHLTPERGVLLVTHDHRLERFADRVVRLLDGRIDGATEEAA